MNLPQSTYLQFQINVPTESIDFKVQTSFGAYKYNEERQKEQTINYILVRIYYHENYTSAYHTIVMINVPTESIDCKVQTSFGAYKNNEERQKEQTINYILVEDILS